MPSIQQIFEATQPVVVAHGNVTVTLDVALERKSRNMEEWQRLQDEAEVIRNKIRYGALDADALVERLSSPDAEAVPNWEEELKRIKADNAAQPLALHHSMAARIAFLCPSWDITQTGDADSPMAPLTAESVAVFSEELVSKMCEEIEKKTGLSLTM